MYSNVDFNEIEYIARKDSNEIEIIQYKGKECDVIFPDSYNINGEEKIIEHICANVFCETKHLKSVRFPANVTYIDSNTFEGQTELTDVRLPEKIQYIYDYVFKDCLSLKNINLEKVCYIGIGAFQNCISLRNLEIANCICKEFAFRYAIINKLSIELGDFLYDVFFNAKIGIIDIKSDARFLNSFNRAIVGNLILNQDSIPDFSHESFKDSMITINNFSKNEYHFDKQIKYYKLFTYNELVRIGYKENQINQITLAYKDGLLLSMLPPEIDNSVFRLIREKYKINPIDTVMALNSTPEISSLYPNNTKILLNKLEMINKDNTNFNKEDF